jgi:hypothetical protein
MTLKQAVKRLGGPNRAATLYNLAYKGQRDALGARIERLPRSTLETWVNGTSKTKATDSIRRVIQLAGRSDYSLFILLNPPKRSSRGKAQKAPKDEAQEANVAR